MANVSGQSGVKFKLAVCK